MTLNCEINYSSKNKRGEEVCGDSLKILRSDYKTCLTISDGLGSGIKASILSLLTASIATTMVFNKVPLDEVVRSILSTLPICKIRKISYANFCIFDFDSLKNHCTILEYEFPIVLYYRKGEQLKLIKNKIEISGRDIFESSFEPQEGDSLFLMTDGVSMAGMGTPNYPLGFGVDTIAREIGNMLKSKINHKEIIKHILNRVNKLDEGISGDDAMVAGIFFRQPRILTMLVGPPSNPNLDEFVINNFIKQPGKKVICGGTTGNIASRVLKKPVKIDLTTATPNSPPLAYMEGVNLITEGIMTLTQIYRYLESQESNPGIGAKILLELIEEADSINFIVGRALNSAHQNPLFSHDISLKFRLIKDIASILEKKGKIIKTSFY